jgi:catechol 2,3-dioxygenase-like lactoylglutathione lyase family enzyme
LTVTSFGLDHVQVAAPAGCEAAARAFYGGLLGLAEIEKPASLAERGGVWFELDAAQLHVGVDPSFAPARKAHPGLRLPPPRIDALAAVLAGAGVPVRWDEAIAGRRRFFCEDPWGNRLEILGGSPADAEVLVVRQGEERLQFTFAEMSRYNGGHSPGGVAHAFKVLELSLRRLCGDAIPDRRDLSVRTAFGGPGARDGFELVTRAVTGGRYAVDASLERPELGRARQRFVFVVSHRDRSVELRLRDGFVTEEFVDLAGVATRSDDQEARLTVLKDELAARLMALPADSVYEVF